MTSSERGIYFTNDLDGVHFRAPAPLRTTVRLLRGDTKLPEVGSPVGEYVLPEGWRGIVGSKWSILFHKVRPVNKDALEGLGMFEQAAEKHNRELIPAALSGRETDKHAMTIERLREVGLLEHFVGGTYLNEGKKASRWKEQTVRRLVEDGYNVVHIDDDVRPGLCIGRINDEYPDEERVLVYIIRNVSNAPWLLRRSGLTVPENVIFVPSFKHAATDFDSRLAEHRI